MSHIASRFTTLSCLVLFAAVLQPSLVFGDELTGTLMPEPLVDLEDSSQNLGQDPGTFHPSKMDVGPDGKIYFNSAIQNTTYRVDENGVLERVAVYGGGCPVIGGPGFLLGLQFDSDGNLYAVNCAGLWKVDAGDIPEPGEGPFDASGGLLFDIPDADTVVPMSVGTDLQGHAYVSDMVGGKIYKVNTSDGSPGAGADATGLWADNDEYPLLGNPHSDNFLKGFPLCPADDEGVLRCGFGICEVMPGPKGKWLYYTNHEGNAVYRIKIGNDGSAKQVTQVDHVPPFAFNGAYLDPAESRIIASSPFMDFDSGFGVAEPAGTLFIAKDLKSKIETLAVMELSDGEMAVPVDVVSGRDVGSGHPDRLYVLDGSFDTLHWPPTGIRPADEVFDFYRNPHAAIRVIQLEVN